MKRPRVLLACVAMAGALAAHAQDKPCGATDSAAAAKAVDRIVTWPQLLKAWQDYRQCDSGGVADAFTDALMRMMVEWKSPDQLADAMARSPEYAAFITRHLKSAAKEDRESAYSRAKQDCPGGLAAFCEKVLEASKP
jgi:phage/plasmid primase-like uncharacterized protein